MKFKDGSWRALLAVSVVFGLGAGKLQPRSRPHQHPLHPRQATAAPSLAPEPSATADPLPDLTLTAGENYFRLNGVPTFIYSRNLAD